MIFSFFVRKFKRYICFFVKEDKDEVGFDFYIVLFFICIIFIGLEVI